MTYLADRRCPQRAAQRAERLDPKTELALTLQAMYASQGLSLTDPATATTFQIALSAVMKLVDGAHAQDMVGTEEHRALQAMLEDMQQAPTLV
ncbi:hypothetical protein [Streptomyces sp. NPDC046371]|uniref:hypothetical protein n=1 Tax=Streptomyces sp. NPDC046371 TaxID=3154916 RepID=UPI0033DC2A65